MFFLPIFQSFKASKSILFSPLLSVGLPLIGGAKSLSETGISVTFVANHVIFSCGMANPKMVPGNPVKDSGPPANGI